MVNIFIGFDKREPEATIVAKASLLKHSSIDLNITSLGEDNYRQAGLYDRPCIVENGQRYDTRDKKPFSTDFSFTRFLVPVLMSYQNWAVFCDGDFLFRDDIKKVLDKADDKYAVMCVKHNYRPEETVKMDGQKQELYPRKNWSSFVLWNCSHPSNLAVTLQRVNFSEGSALHGFSWLKDEEIGEIDERWNWLEGWSDEAWEPSAVHMTRGIPTMKGYEKIPHAEEWRTYLDGNHEL
jgi:hypothetical protein